MSNIGRYMQPILDEEGCPTGYCLPVCISGDSITIEAAVPIVAPECYQWNDAGTIREVVAYAVTDEAGAFVEWVVLSGTAPPDLTLPGALTRCDEELVPPVVAPGCFQWDNAGTIEQVTAYAAVDETGAFVRWVVLSGNPPGDLTIPGALTFCVEAPSDLATSPQCYQWDNAGTPERVTAYAVTDETGTFERWVVLSGTAPPDLTLPGALTYCEEEAACAEQEQEAITTGAAGPIPAGFRAVEISNLTGTTTVAGGYILGDGSKVDTVALNSTNHPCINGVLPAITVAGGTFQWIGIGA